MTNLELLKTRHSVRSFSPEPVSVQHLNKLRSLVTMVNTHQQGLRFQLFTDDPEPFAGFSKSYGIFKNPRNYLAAVAEMSTPDVRERAGYYAEQFVMKALELGIGTCFVGGTYSGGGVKAQLRAGEKVLFLVVFGYPADKTRILARLMTGIVHRKKMRVADFFEPEDKLPEAVGRFPELKDGLEAVACAPSSLNKRPARIFVGSDGDGAPCLCARVDGSNPKQLTDLGIAKFNYNFATGTECMWGNGAPLDGGDSRL